MPVPPGRLRGAGARWSEAARTAARGQGWNTAVSRNVVLKLSIDLSLEPGPIWDDILARELRFHVLLENFPARCVYRDNVLRPCYNLGSIKADYKHANARPRFTGLRRMPAAPTWSFG